MVTEPIKLEAGGLRFGRSCADLSIGEMPRICLSALRVIRS